MKHLEFCEVVRSLPISPPNSSGGSMPISKQTLELVETVARISCHDLRRLTGEDRENPKSNH